MTLLRSAYITAIGKHARSNDLLCRRGAPALPPAPGDRGTEVRVELEYAAPGGAIGATIAKLFGEEPGQRVGADLRHFKQVMEAGEVVYSEATVHDHPHPARPPDGHTERRQG